MSQENVEVVRRVYRGQRSARPRCSSSALYDPEVEWITRTTAKAWPEPGVDRGHAGLRKMVPAGPSSGKSSSAEMGGADRLWRDSVVSAVTVKGSGQGERSIEVEVDAIRVVGRSEIGRIIPSGYGFMTRDEALEAVGLRE